MTMTMTRAVDLARTLDSGEPLGVTEAELDELDPPMSDTPLGWFVVRLRRVFAPPFVLGHPVRLIPADWAERLDVARSLDVSEAAG